MQRSFAIAAAALALLAATLPAYGQEEVIYFDAQTGARLLHDTGYPGQIVYGATSAESNSSRVTPDGTATSRARLNGRMAKLEVSASDALTTELMMASAHATTGLHDTLRFKTGSQVDLVTGGIVEFDYYFAWQMSGSSYVSLSVGDLVSDYWVDHFQANQLNVNSPDQFGRSFGHYTLSLPLTSVVAIVDADGEWLANCEFWLSLSAIADGGGSNFWNSLTSKAVVEYRISGGRVWDSTRTTAYPIVDEFQTAVSDFNADGRVDGADFLEWQRGNGDASGDGVSGQFDLEIWKHQFGLSSTSEVAQVPEASSLAISMIAAVTLILRSRHHSH